MRTTGYQGTTRGANLTQCAANYTRYLRRALPENPESYYKLELGAWILALSLRVDVAVVTFFFLIKKASSQVPGVTVDQVRSKIQISAKPG